MSADPKSYKDQFDEVMDEVKTESDRSAVIILAAELDTRLHKSLRKFFLPPLGSRGQRQLLFEPESQIGSFSMRTELAYRAKLISEEVHRELSFIRKIRNVFAHGGAGTTFSQDTQKSYVQELMLGKNRVERDKEVLSRTEVFKDWSYERSVFVISSVRLMSRLDVCGHRVEEVQPKFAEEHMDLGDTVK